MSRYPEISSNGTRDHRRKRISKNKEVGFRPYFVPPQVQTLLSIFNNLCCRYFMYCSCNCFSDILFISNSVNFLTVVSLNCFCIFHSFCFSCCACEHARTLSISKFIIKFLQIYFQKHKINLLTFQFFAQWTPSRRESKAISVYNHQYYS